MKVIAVSHGSYSKGLVDSVQILVGEQENLVAYGLFPEQTVATLTEQLEREVNDTPEGEEILFLTDLFHGSPFNAVVSLMRNHEFHHITGINIPLFWRNIFRMSVVPVLMFAIGLTVARYIDFGRSWGTLFAGIIVYTLLFSVGSYFITFNAYEKEVIHKALKKRAS